MNWSLGEKKIKGHDRRPVHLEMMYSIPLQSIYWSGYPALKQLATSIVLDVTLLLCSSSFLDRLKVEKYSFRPSLIHTFQISITTPTVTNQ